MNLIYIFWSGNKGYILTVNSFNEAYHNNLDVPFILLIYYHLLNLIIFQFSSISKKSIKPKQKKERKEEKRENEK